MKNVLSFLGRLWDFIRPTVLILSTKLGKALLAIAQEGFAEAVLNDNLKTDAERRAFVFRKLREHDLTSGNAIADNVLWFVIRQAEKRYVRTN